jgi:prepilin-type N-terminal cleavage/methylation domain-containing protein
VNKLRTYKAFTLVELLVAMAVSVIVIAMAYMAFLFLTQRFIQQKNTTEKITNMYRLKDLLLHDYQKAHFAEFDDRELFLKTHQSIIIYTAHPREQMITRMLQDRTDTFWVANQGFETIDAVQADDKKALKLRLGSGDICVPIEQKQTLMQKIRSLYEN